MSSTQKPGDGTRSLPDDIALSAGMPRGHQAGSLHDVPTPGTYTAANHTAGTETHSIHTGAGSAGVSGLVDEAKSRASDLRDRAADIASDAGERVSDRVRDLQDRAGEAYEDARDWATDSRREGQRRLGEFGERGTARLRDGKSAVEDFVSENPLLVGVVGLAAGLLIGALLPRTRTEDQNVGPWADEVRDQSLRLARDVTHRGREFVASALDPENLNAVVQRAAGTGDGAAPQADGRPPQGTAPRAH